MTLQESKNSKITRSYTMEPKVLEKLIYLRNTQGISSSWLINRAVEKYIEEEYEV